MDSLLYCNDDAACAENAVTAVNTERGLSLCYIPGKSALYSLDDFLQLILILTVIFIIIMLAFLFADKTVSAAAQNFQEVFRQYEAGRTTHRSRIYMMR